MRAFGLFVLCLVTFAQPAFGRDELDLHLQLKKGDAHTMNVAIRQTIDQTVRGIKQETTQTIAVDYTFMVEGVDAQGASTISIRYDSVAFHAMTPAGPVDYDSANPPGQVPAMASALAALVGQTYSLTVTPQGKVTQVGGVQKLLDNVLAKLDIPEGPARAAAERALRGQLNEQSLAANLQNVFAPFPDHPAALGESWRRNVQINLGFPLTIESTYTLAGRDRGIATVSVQGNVATAPDASIGLGQMKMSYDLSGRQHGSLQIAESTGWTRMAEISQRLTGSATIRVPDALPQTVPMTIQSDMKIQQSRSDQGGQGQATRATGAEKEQ